MLRRFRTGVSLHSHTLHSREALEFVPRIVASIPLVRGALRALEGQYERRYGRALNYADAYWTPPLSERESLTLERSQIEDFLQLESIVWLSDHDNIEAANHLALFEDFRGAAVSVEWTVPFGPSFFHLGIHNLPPEQGRAWMDRLAVYTALPSIPMLHELLVALAAVPRVLIVLNHPFWDEKGLGADRHAELLRQFLGKFRGLLHALELNGMRPWTENQDVVALAEARKLPVVAGGDRHGSEANTVLNLTCARGLDEFIEDVRRRKWSDVLLLRTYREPFRQRFAEAVWDILRDYPEHTGRIRWTDRVFYRTPFGSHVPLASAWKGEGPGIVGAFGAALRLFGSRRVRNTLRLAMRTRSEVLP
ncbi:MAG: hypothetical protein NTY38_12680 [Acidobacteria bacterium]|nr:hypothetical protein [Acidobacteriota bacterium]